MTYQTTRPFPNIISNYFMCAIMLHRSVLLKDFRNQEHANAIKKTQTRSRTREHDQEHTNTNKHVRAPSKFLFQDRENIFEDNKKHTQLTIQEMTNQDFVTQFVERSPKRNLKCFINVPGAIRQIFYIPGESEKTWGVWRTVTSNLAIRLR